MTSRNLDGRRPKTSAYERQAHDHYTTGEPLTESLLDCEPLGPIVWEPACGDGRMARLMIDAGMEVIATDKYAWGYGEPGVDFLRCRRLRAPIIATNPPFSLWREFAAHALDLGADKVVLLGRTLLQEGARLGEDIFDRYLVRVWQSRRRVNLAPPGALDKGHNTKLAFAWYVLDRNKPAADYGAWTVRGFKPRAPSKRPA
jgi:hypothetical protein